MDDLYALSTNPAEVDQVDFVNPMRVVLAHMLYQVNDLHDWDLPWTDVTCI